MGTLPISLSSFPQMKCFSSPFTGEPEALFVYLADKYLIEVRLQTKIG